MGPVEGCEQVMRSSQSKVAGCIVAISSPLLVLEEGGPDTYHALLTTLTSQQLPTQVSPPLWDFAFVSM